MKKVSLYGAGEHGKVVRDIARELGVCVENFYDDKMIESYCGLPVKTLEQIQNHDIPIIISIGDNNVRKRFSEILSQKGLSFEKMVHPSAILSSDVKIGVGSMVSAGVIIQTGCNIGRHCIINTGAIIDHECKIDDYVHISPGSTLCGKVEIGEGTWIGAGTIVIPGVKIGKWSVVGAGSLVLKDIPDNVMAFGSPCKIYRNLF